MCFAAEEIDSLGRTYWDGELFKDLGHLRGATPKNACHVYSRNERDIWEGMETIDEIEL